MLLANQGQHSVSCYVDHGMTTLIQVTGLCLFQGDPRIILTKYGQSFPVKPAINHAPLTVGEGKDSGERLNTLGESKHVGERVNTVGMG